MTKSAENTVTLRWGDALIIVDVQNDFLPGGALAVPSGDAVIDPLNDYAAAFATQELTIVATRDWHPADHCSFKSVNGVDQGGIWPPHCVQNTEGATFSADLRLSEETIVISKADKRESDAYSGFEGTELNLRLRELGTRRVFIGGLATDYCVLNTVLDALALGYETFLLVDAIRAVNVAPQDGQRAVSEMLERGARPLDLSMLAFGAGERVII